MRIKSPPFACLSTVSERQKTKWHSIFTKKHNKCKTFLQLCRLNIQPVGSWDIRLLDYTSIATSTLVYTVSSKSVGELATN